MGGIWPMDKDYFVDLTTRVYNLTLQFPKKEPLRYQIRHLANDILQNLIFILWGNIKNPRDLLSDIEKRLETLDGFLNVAESQNWVSSEDILEIQKEYSNIRREIEKFKKQELKKSKKRQKSKVDVKKEVTTSLPVLEEDVEEELSLNDRQEKILEILKEKDKIQVHHVKDVFPDISKRTLRRDFESLLKQGLVERIGKRSNTFYRLIDRTRDRTEVS